MYSFFYSIIVFVVSILCLYHWRNQPLYADDGNWFNDAEFDNEISLYRLDYFGIGFIAKYFRKVYFVKSEKAYYDLKIIWFSLLNSVLFITCYVLFNDYLIAVLSVLFHIIFQVLPQTRYSLTYGENFLLLPVLIGFLVLRAAFISNNLFLYLLTGLFFGWAYQIKVVAIIAIAFLVLLSFFYINYINLLVMISGFLIINFLQVFKAKGFKNILFLTKCLFKWHLYFYIFSSKLIKLSVFKKFYSFDKKEDNSYVSQRAKVSHKYVLNEFNKSIMPTIQNTFLICILSLSMLFYNIINYDFNVTIVSAFFIGCFMIPIAEKSFFPGHFNQVWLPVSVLAALGFKSIIDSNNLFFMVFLSILLIYNSYFIIKQIRKRLSNQTILADYPEYYSLFFKNAELIGKDINTRSSSSDYLLVWGSCPSIHIYSKRKVFDRNVLHFYFSGNLIVAHKLKVLLKLIKDFPPKYILFYKLGIKDNYDINYIITNTRIPYVINKQYDLATLSGKNISRESLYCVDLKLIKEIIIDRFLTNYYKDFKQVEIYERLQSYFSLNEIKLLCDFKCENPNTELEIYLTVFKCLQSSDVELATTLLNNIQDMHFESINSLLQGEIAFMKQQHLEAYKYFKLCTELNPYIATSWNNLGVLMYNQNLLLDAQECFNKAIILNSNYLEAINNRNSISKQI